jgi:hypothetical protein
VPPALAAAGKRRHRASAAAVTWGIGASESGGRDFDRDQTESRALRLPGWASVRDLRRPDSGPARLSPGPPAAVTVPAAATRDRDSGPGPGGGPTDSDSA